MSNQFGHYPKIYVKNKSELFPLIEKYYGRSVNGMNHGQVVKIYLHLLKNNPDFVSEVDTIGNKYHYATDTVGAIAEAIGTIFGTFQEYKKSKNISDSAFYEAMLTEQKRDDTTKILIISGIALVVVGFGIFMVFKLKKKPK